MSFSSFHSVWRSNLFIRIKDNFKKYLIFIFQDCPANRQTIPENIYHTKKVSQSVYSFVRSLYLPSPGGRSLPVGVSMGYASILAIMSS